MARSISKPVITMRDLAYMRDKAGGAAFVQVAEALLQVVLCFAGVIRNTQ